MVCPVNTLSTIILAIIGYYGGFSRLTHGKYTPKWHAYQVDRAPNDGSALSRIIPIIDIVLSSCLLISSSSRRIAVRVILFLFTMGVVQRWRSGKSCTPDFALFSIALTAYLTSS
eukprot:TRINITY_DN9889_c0_g1_i1.p1 TRINITY_DN9889_c0_g1~~TRINITY_DN9889_c0_g1_i1.p1  ORF type:complete len:115 (+),score=3.45 TRINITY_DN9889_c0_g1_i1:44-388(+)